MNRRQLLAGGAAGAAWAAAAGYTMFGRGGGPQLLNASYDATRDLFRKLNRLFAERQPARVRVSHGGSGSQARAVIDGLPADVVTLAFWPDLDAVRKAGLLAAGWEDRLPNRSLPYTSTIVFVVRKGNPHGVRDWPDLASKPGLRIVTANPKTSGAAKLGLLSAWGSVVRAGGSDADAERFVGEVYRRVPALESSSRAATVTFARKRIGDVHVTWENEARLECRELPDEMEVVYPSASIAAEPHVAVVDRTAERNGTRDLAEAYLRFLYEPAAQAVIAGEFFRPTAVPAVGFPAIEMFPVTAVARGGWDEAQKRFFADGGVFDRVYAGRA